MVSTTKCVVCKTKSASEKVTKLNPKSLQKLWTILTARRKHNLKFSDVVLPKKFTGNNLGYHISCYRSFTAVNKQYLVEDPPIVNVDEIDEKKNLGEAPPSPPIVNVDELEEIDEKKNLVEAPPPSPPNINVDVIDEKFTTVEGRAVGQPFCHTCLSHDRALFPLGKYADVYHNISSNFVVMDLPLKLVCWECTAIMKKIKLFQTRVECSQRLLLSHFADKQTPLPSLSSLTSTIIKPELAFNIVFEETDKKPQIEIIPQNFVTETNINESEIKNEEDIQVKEETADDFDYDIDSNDDWTGLDGLKSEEEDNEDKDEQNDESNVRKKIYPNREKKHDKFKIISKVTKKQIDEMCKTKYVGFDDIKNVLEKEVHSDLYKSKYKCKSCVLSWPKVKDFNRHDEKFHKITSNFVCEYCKCRFKSKRRLKTHIGRHRELVECRACGHQAAGRSRMVRHLAHAHRVRCKACEATFRSVVQFYRHHRQHHELFICDYCGRKCKMRSTLERHIASFHMEKYVCETCNAQFKMQRALRAHVARKHAAGGGEHAYCVECDVQFPNAVQYREHIRSWITHQKEDRKRCICTCPECGKTYLRRQSLRNHYNFVHKKQSKYVCRECDTQFLNRTKYTDHIRIVHEGKKKPKNKLCPICGRGFTENRILTNHLRTHTGERPHACALCPAAFAQSVALQSHRAHVHLRLKRRKPDKQS